MKCFKIAKFKEPLIQNVPFSQKMLIDVQLSISCSLKSDKVQGIHVRTEIETMTFRDDLRDLLQ